MAWLASPRDTATTIALSLLSGVFTAFGLLATTGVLTALFEAGPTPERVRAALPSLVLVGVAATLRTLTQAGAGWAQSRLDPQVSRIAEERLYGLTSRVGLAAFDDPDFHDALQRARARGVSMADVVVGTAIDVLTAAIGIVAAAGVLGVLHPVLLPLLVLAVLPDAWAAVRAARMRYTTMYRLIPSGKTTLAKILSGLYEPDGGRVRWDGTDLSEVDPDRLRRHIAVIAQDHTRWPLTARQNITMGTDKGEPALVSAAEVAGADQVVADLPHGYDTLLDRRFKDGQELSGGQWQRIAVARGFHRDAPLLICDEPTAALDARAEHALFERVREHAGGRTVLLITHRLASVRYADRIYVLDHGKVTEEGTHTELMELGGLYAELYGLQARAYSP
ncbi:ATP-binding cassette domain-containing protein [Planomonospora parontospora]|uniref:ATP-binding cassette domain-containing protein n=1 Tax=Planomonospora parontospora TaxID=58119 RepID=UPI0035A26102